MDHLQAKQMVDGLGVTPAESLYMRAVSWHETNYGSGWKPPGDKSNNMGAIIAPHPDALSFTYQDSKFDAGTGGAKSYVAYFAGYPTPLAGMTALRDTLLKSNVKAALARGDLYGAVGAQYMNGYFMGLHSHTTPEGNRANIDDYYAALSSALRQIYSATGEAAVLVPKARGEEPKTPVASVPVSSSSPSALPALSRGDVVPDADLRLRLLRVGMKGPLVRVWQYLLLAESPGFFATGTFDSETEIATRAWQAKMGLPADGVVGLMSWERMLS